MIEKVDDWLRSRHESMEWYNAMYVLPKLIPKNARAMIYYVSNYGVDEKSHDVSVAIADYERDGMIDRWIIDRTGEIISNDDVIAWAIVPIPDTWFGHYFTERDKRIKRAAREDTGPTDDDDGGNDESTAD